MNRTVEDLCGLPHECEARFLTIEGLAAEVSDRLGRRRDVIVCLASEDGTDARAFVALARAELGRCSELQRAIALLAPNSDAARRADSALLEISALVSIFEARLEARHATT